MFFLSQPAEREKSLPTVTEDRHTKKKKKKVKLENGSYSAFGGKNEALEPWFVFQILLLKIL